ncbi:hypothetical protein [Liberiplasma polymorphum]|uniref:hypothetical protein n=1 Tax=Liberiplasma polymorphum TaxID=3374570 RepID=UPI00377184A3
MKKVLFGFLLVTLFLAFGTEVKAETGVRYNTFTVSNNRLVRTQTAYVPVAQTRFVGGISLDEPTDIHITPNDVMYITTNTPTGGKIIVFDLKTEEAYTVGEGFLNNPTGVFANDNGDIYVADRLGQIAYKLDHDGNILQTYTRPTSPLFGSEDFQPRKIVSDPRGNVYILNLGTRGLAQFSNDGEFLGYFGTNTIQPTLRTVLQFIFFTEAQRARLFNLSPPEISNIAIDQRGLIHTSSLGVEGQGVKRLNISGGNLLPEMLNAPDLVDIFVGPIGNIYTITRSGMIYEYDREGNLLFAFGGQDISNQIQGLFNTPAGIAVDSTNTIYTLDRASGEIKIFVPTEFTNLVHQALASYQDGNYIASQGPWEEVLKMNDFFDLAHRGLGNAYFSLNRYDEALEEYYIAYDRAGYSDAFWEVRNEWLLANAGVGVAGFFILLIGFVINMKVNFTHFMMNPIKKGIRKIRDKVKVIDDILYLFTYLKNPADASYFIKRRNQVSAYSVTVLLAIYFMLYIYYIYNLNFLFNFRHLDSINIVEELVKVVLPVILWVFCNFLIGTIREGEGRLKDVYITTVYSLAPYFLMLPVITIISNGLTYNEAFIVTFVTTISIGVTVLYFFFMVKETHFYNVKETIQSIVISAFTMAMMLLGLFIVYILLNELFILIKDLVLEVFYRVTNT